MAHFRRIENAPAASLREQVNAVAQAVERLLRLSATPPLEVGFLNGSPHFRLQDGSFEPVRVVFTEALAIGGQAVTHRLSWNESVQEWEEVSPAEELLVHDDGLNDTAAAEQQAWVFYSSESRRYYVLRSEKQTTTVVTQFCCEEGAATVCDINIGLEGDFTLPESCCEESPEPE